MKRVVYIACIVLGFSGCIKKKVNTVGEYSKWINEPENGLIITKRIKGLEISVKYLPSEYLTFKEITESGDNSEKNAQRIKKEYESAITFLMTIGPDESKNNNNDIMFEDIKNYKEYSERLLSLNFEMDKNVTLKAAHVELKPVLSALENTYGLSKSRNVMFVFSPNDKEIENIKKADAIDFVYTDELFSLGIMHFNFQRNNIENLPIINRK